MKEFIPERVENIVGEEEKGSDCLPEFLLFPQFFQKLSFPGVVKSMDSKE